jgi:hypothetical protein
MADKIKPPQPPDNSVESLRIAFQQMAQNVEKHVTGAAQTVIQRISGGGGGGAGGGSGGGGGTVGPTGPPGPAGTDGSTGATGGIGPTGPTGPAGAGAGVGIFYNFPNSGVVVVPNLGLLLGGFDCGDGSTSPAALLLDCGDADTLPTWVGFDCGGPV